MIEVSLTQPVALVRDWKDITLGGVHPANREQNPTQWPQSPGRSHRKKQKQAECNHGHP